MKFVGINIRIFKTKRAETEKGLSRKHIIEGVKASLERLQLEYVDIVYANKPDAHTPMEGKQLEIIIFFIITFIWQI